MSDIIDATRAESNRLTLVLQLKFVTSIVNISTPDGKKGFTPNKVRSHPSLLKTVR